MQNYDLLLSLVSILFSISLIPQIIKSFKEQSVNISWITIIISIVGLMIISIVNSFIGMNFYCICNTFTACCWLILGFMKYFTKDL